MRHGIPHIDLVRTYLGLLCQGKNDFEAVEEVRKDLFFQQALEIGRVPSSARLRQRFDEQAEALTQAADDCIVPMLKNLRATVSALPTGHVALHQASLRSRERFWDIRVPKIDSIFDNSLVPRPSWSPGVPPQHRKLVAAIHRSPI